MNARTLIGRSLMYFRRTHVGVVLGAMIATAVLVGALAVGDSVRHSLRRQALARIGGVDAALAVRDRFFGADLAARVASDLRGGVRVAAALHLPGIAARAGGTARTGIVDILGVDEHFLAMAPEPQVRTPAAGQAFLNEPLATQLGVQVGDQLLLRIEKPSALPRDLGMATIDDVSLALTVDVGAIVTEAAFGRFSLRAGQVPPFNVFVSSAWLQEKLLLDGRANLLLAAGAKAAALDEALRRCWTLADAELQVTTLPGTEVGELTSDRVFIDRPVVEAVARIAPQSVGVLTYFVNALRRGERATPYSMVTAIGPLVPGSGVPVPVLPAGLTDDDIVLNDWCARDLEAKPGDALMLDYYVSGPDLRLIERSHTLRVHGQVPLAGAAADPSLMPAFPGLTDSENCRDWETGLPIDLDRIRDVDEQYWDEYRGTPKAFVTLRTGQALWGNRFGTLTAIRGAADLGERLEQQLPRALDPAALGLFFSDVRESALATGAAATDFGGLFLGLSFFLVVAALILTALLFVFGVEQRAGEIGTLLALGLPPRQVRRWFLSEALLLATLGGLAGAGLGLAYTRAVLYGLGTLWRGAVGATTLTFHAAPTTVVAATLGAIVTSLLALAWTLRRVFDRPAVELLRGRGDTDLSNGARAGRWSVVLAIGAPLLALCIVLVVGAGSAQAAAAFFGAGALLLIGGLAQSRRSLLRWAQGAKPLASLMALGMRNAGRRPGRSLATIALLASGTFLVVGVQANRLAPPRDALDRASGTGGFALFGRSTLPVLRDLDSEAGREAYGLDAAAFAGVSVVPLRLREGDDASCLNLSLPQNPGLLGVRPQALAERGAFRFAAVLSQEVGEPPANPWLLLTADYGDVVPAIGDQASVTWSMHKTLGDSLDYRDEAGQVFRVRIVATLADSILQGSLVIANEAFERRFPSVSGQRLFLVDAPPAGADAVGAELTRALADVGFEVTRTTDRLQAFHAVQNTYLLIFQALGGLGLLLGSAGLGMVVLRNALERRSELATLGAVGFTRRAIRGVVWSEHALLLALGLLIGVVAALLALTPSLLDAGSGLSLSPMLALVAGVAASGALWVALATRLALRGELLAALRQE